MIAPETMAIRRTGVFAGEFLPDSSMCFGTDASGGPRGEDPRLRVVSWAVVAIRVDFRGPAQAHQLNYEVLGTMSGTLQIGATVNDGESVALDKLAQWATQKVHVAVDSKVAIKRCLVADIHRKYSDSDVWTRTVDERGFVSFLEKP